MIPHTTSLLLVLCLFAQFSILAEVVTYDAPKEEILSTDYQVTIGGKKVDVYTARVLDPPFAGKEWDFGGNYSFANFDLRGEAEVRITSARDLRNVAVRPTNPHVAYRLESDGSLVIKLSGPAKLSIEPDGKKGPLLLFANPMEEFHPSEGAPGMVYFGPGIHKPGRIELKSNQTLYIAGGAVVKSAVIAEGDNIKIRGRGILDGSDWAWQKGPNRYMVSIAGSDIEISDITIRGSWGWTIVPRHSRNVTIRNVKLCNSRVQNDDGIDPCNSQDLLITDCFIRTDDDCIAMKGLKNLGPASNVERITVENSILWCDRARIFLLGHECRADFMRQIAIRNIDILHFRRTPFLLEPGEEMRLEEVTIENVRLNAEGQSSLVRIEPVVNQYMAKKVPGRVLNITLRNIAVQGKPGESKIQIKGADKDHAVRRVRVEKLTILDRRLTLESPEIVIGKNASDITFQ